jgi:tRNA pseudouridine13 synthase
VDQAEVSCLAEFGMRPADLEHPADEELDITAGTRRPLRVPITNIDVEGGVDEHGSYVRCAFDLPRGSFATTVMREVMKPERMELIEEE